MTAKLIRFRSRLFEQTTSIIRIDQRTNDAGETWRKLLVSQPKHYGIRLVAGA
ncbi:MAG TPA: hypothetical protein VJ733_08445 [Candidatus Binatia bacterium]|nr:hypothetical protein [Candidatus Binatia bacterium]